VKGKLFKKGVSGIVEMAVRKIEASKDSWADATIQGFREGWAEWMSLLEPGLRTKIAGLPAKTTNIEENVKNRVTPIALYISETSQRYRNRKLTGYAPLPPVRAR
jgi:hypothetical protein